MAYFAGKDRSVEHYLKNLMEEAARKTPGVKDCTVSFMTLKMKVEFDEGADVDAVMKNVRDNCKKVEDDCEIFL
jgi:hypothetical protein